MAWIVAITTLGVIVTGAPFLLAWRGIKDFGTLGGLTSSTLTNVGTALLLAAALVLLERRFTAKVNENTERVVRARVDPLSERVSAFKATFERRLSDIENDVTDRLAAERQADQDAFERLRNATDRAVVVEALHRALSQKLITRDRPPRVLVDPTRDLYISLDFTGPPGDVFEALDMRVEAIGGKSLWSTNWNPFLGITDAMVLLGNGLHGAQGTFSVSDMFGAFADLLTRANALHERTPVIEFVAPQWFVTPTGLTAIGHDYTLTQTQLRSPRVHLDMQGKQWVDDNCFEQALSVWHALNPAF